MKKIFLLSLLFILSCKPDKDELNFIQIMAYNYEHDSITQHLKPKPVMYSSINELGKAKVLEKLLPQNDTIVAYSFSIDQKLIEQIKSDINLREESYFTKSETSEIEIYDGPVIRIKISSNNEEEISFMFYDINYHDDSKFYIYKKLYNFLLENNKSMLLKTEDVEFYKIKQKDFAEYVHHKDTLLFPMPPIMPPAPKLDEVKFVKPK